MPSVSIVIPAYNEEQRLPGSLLKVHMFLKPLHLDYEVIVVNDGSTDATVAEAKKFSAQFPDFKMRLLDNSVNRGKGACVKQGMLDSKKEICLFTDADLSTPISFLPRFLELHGQGFDVVVASRALKESKVTVHQPFHREKMGRVFNTLVRLVAGLDINDTQCGFKSFTRKAALDIFSRQTIDRFGFDVEILYIAKIKGLRVKEEPVEWFNSAASTVSPLKDSARMFVELFEIKQKHKKGMYN